MKNLEQEILKKALEPFRKLTGLVVETKIEARLAEDKLVDAMIWIPKFNANLHAEIKPHVTNQTLGAIAYQVKAINAKAKVRTILVTRYITPQMADRLKEMDMQFLDIAGNAYINLPNMYIFIKGNNTKEGIIKEKPIRAFQPAGLQLIYALLCIPELEKQPYRTMADAANIANGAVTWAIKDLKKLGYIVDMGNKGRVLVKKKELLQRWVNLYAELLRPKLFIGRYKTEDLDWWKRQNITNVNAQFGGETAAAMLTKYLKPQNHTIYTEENYGRLLLQLKLKNDPNGNIEVLKKFWKFNEVRGNNNLVDPVLIYADLLATGDNRNIETAKLIYDKEIVRYIGEDR